MCRESRMTEERQRLKRGPRNEDAIASMCPCDPKSLSNNQDIVRRMEKG